MEDTVPYANATNHLFTLAESIRARTGNAITPPISFDVALNLAIEVMKLDEAERLRKTMTKYLHPNQNSQNHEHRQPSCKAKASRNSNGKRL